MDLLPEQLDTLERFCEITAIDDTARELWTGVLRNAGWSLEAAVEHFYSGAPPAAVPAAIAADAAVANAIAAADAADQWRAVVADVHDDGIFPLLLAAPTLAAHWEQRVVAAPPARPLALLVILWWLPRGIWWVVARLWRVLFPWSAATSEPFPSQYEGVPKAQEEPSEFKEKTEPTEKEAASGAIASGYARGEAGGETDGELRGPSAAAATNAALTAVSFNELHQAARATHTALLIVLTAPGAASQDLCAALMAAPFQTFLEQHGAALYAREVSDAEAWEVGRVYRARRLPFVALVGRDPRGVGMSILAPARRFTPATGERIQRVASAVLARYEPEWIAARAEEREWQGSRELRGAQDAAYEASLAEDRKKRAERQRAEQQQCAEQHRAQRRERRVARRARREQPAPSAAAAAIQFRMADGSRLIGRFEADAPTRAVYQWVEMQRWQQKTKDTAGEGNPENENAGAEDGDSGDDSDADEFAFELLLTFPRVLIESGATRVDEVKELWPRGSLIVEDCV